jgi:hypothetical protein
MTLINTLMIIQKYHPQIKNTSIRTAFTAFIVICLFATYVSSLPMVMFPLKPSPSTGPYQDDEFLKIANDSIYSLSGQIMPNGTSLRELETTQQKLATMNISPELYPKAKKINEYLYYACKAGDESSDVMNLADKKGSPEYTDWTVDTQAKTYQNASVTIWIDIQDLYPNATPFNLVPVAKKPLGEKIITQWPKSPFSEFDNDI